VHSWKNEIRNGSNGKMYKMLRYCYEHIMLLVLLLFGALECGSPLQI